MKVYWIDVFNHSVFCAHCAVVMFIMFMIQLNKQVIFLLQGAESDYFQIVSLHFALFNTSLWRIWMNNSDIHI